MHPVIKTTLRMTITVLNSAFFKGSKAALVILIATICVFASPSLLAQSTGLSGYNLQLFRPTVDGKGVITVNGSGVLGHLQPHVGFYSNFSQGLLTATTPVGNRLEIVDSFLTGDVVASIGLWDRVNVGVDIPVFFFERGRNFNTAAVFDTYGVGDARLDIKVQALRDRPRMPGVALLSSVYLPTGETSKFTGYKNVGYQGTVIVDKEFDCFYVAANIGYRFAWQQTAANIDYDDELTFGAGVVVPLPLQDRSVELIAEIYGSSVIKDPKEITTPVEALGGVRAHFGNGLALTVAGGAGLTDGAGSPTYRVLAGITYTFGRKPAVGSIRETIYFDSDKWLIRPKHMDVLDNVALAVKKGKKIEVIVAGHADSTESTRYNLQVSKKRALNVKDYLIKRGINPDSIFIRYYGETQPVATNKTREGRAQNRRVNITSK